MTNNYAVFCGGDTPGLTLLSSIKEVDQFVTKKIVNDKSIFIVVGELNDEFKSYYVSGDKFRFIDVHGEIAHIVFQIDNGEIHHNEIGFDESLIIPGA